MQSALKELQEKFKQKNIGTAPQEEIKKEVPMGNKQGFSNAKKLLELKLAGKNIETEKLDTKQVHLPTTDSDKQKPRDSMSTFTNKSKLQQTNKALQQLPPLPLGLPPPPPPPSLSSLSQANLPTLPPPLPLLLGNNSHNNIKLLQTQVEPQKNTPNREDKIVNMAQNTSKVQDFINIKPITRISLSQQLFGVDVSGYFRSILMANSNILKTMDLSADRKTNKFIFPSIQQQLRNDYKDLTIIFHSDADIVPSYMQYYQSDLNQEIFQKHKIARKVFINKYKIRKEGMEIDWNSNESKTKQLKKLKDSLSFIQNHYFPEIDYSKIKKTHHKIGNIIRKCQREQDYIRCGQFKSKRDRLTSLYESFCKSSTEDKTKINQQLEEIINEVARV